MRRSATCPLSALCLMSALCLTATAHAQPTTPASGARPAAARAIELGAVLNGSWQSGTHALTHRDKGLGLGHSDITADLNIAPWLNARLSGVAHSDHNKIDTRIEEAFLEAPGLPGGLQVRAGRFLSQLGYLNESHPHADDFVMRPLLHRAFLGSHYFDNGARLNWVAPTSVYWRLGAEFLQGKRLPIGYDSGSAGAYTVGTRFGGDLGNSASWQLGWSTLRHRAGAAGAAGSGHAHHAGEAPAAEAAHGDSHAAVFFGRTVDVIDAVWKWAPGGNARSQQLRLSMEHAQVRGFGEAMSPGLRHAAWYLSAVYRFRPQWEAGIRFDRLQAKALHEEGFEPARMDERSVSLTWKPDHMSALRLQWTGQVDRGGFAEASEIKPGRAVHLQFVRSFGAHGAHSY